MSEKVSIFDANVSEAPENPSNDLNTRNGREKRHAESTPEGTVRRAKRASMVVQYVLSSDEEGNCEPVHARSLLNPIRLRVRPFNQKELVIQGLHFL